MLLTKNMTVCICNNFDKNEFIWRTSSIIVFPLEKFSYSLPTDIFRSREKVSITYAILSFFLPTFQWKFQFTQKLSRRFSKNVHSHFTPRVTLACAMASKSYDWNVRNIAKVSPKMSQKQSFLFIFQFSLKLFIRFRRNFLSHYTLGIFWTF